MKRFFLALVFALSAPGGGAALSQAPAPEAVAAAPQTVVDYYLLLPRERYFAKTTEAYLRRIIVPDAGGVTDLSNSYLQTTGDLRQAKTTVRLFPRSDGGPLVAVSANETGDGKWQSFAHFYRYQDGSLVDVTAETVPRPLEPQLGYTLPRQGTTIEVFVAPTKLYVMTTRGCFLRIRRGPRQSDWVWTGSQFKLRRPKVAAPARSPARKTAPAPANARRVSSPKRHR